MDKSQRASLLKIIENIEDEKLCDAIVEFHAIHKTETEPFLINWQKVNLAHAISSYHIGWFKLCRSNLNKALVCLENISKDSFTTNSINAQAKDIDKKYLNEAIEYICHMKPKTY